MSLAREPIPMRARASQTNPPPALRSRRGTGSRRRPYSAGYQAVLPSLTAKPVSPRFSQVGGFAEILAALPPGPEYLRGFGQAGHAATQRRSRQRDYPYFGDTVTTSRDASSAAGGEPSQSLEQTGAYDAFISYSHREDEDLASAVQAGLQRFAKPWYKLRALRVFRDRANLSARPELWASVREALASSRWFVLLASAGAASSSWVNREVSWWLEHRSPEQLIIVATSPGLAWDSQLGDWAVGAPVPPALRGALAGEPLWASLVHLPRQGSRRLPDEAIANIAAPIWNKSKDELVGDQLREHRRTRRMAGGAVAALAFLTVAASVAASLAVVAAQNASHQRNLAVSGELAAESVEFDTTNPVTASQLAAAAWRIEPSAQARESLLQAYAQPQRAIFTTSGPLMADGPQSVAFSPNGKILATATALQTRLWNLATGKEIRPPISMAGECAVAFSPNGKLVALANDEGAVRLWDVTTSHPAGAQIDAGSNQPDAGCVLAFRPDGKMLATGGPDGSLRLWNLRTGKQIGTAITVGGGGVQQVAFNPAGTMLAAADSKSTITMWDVATHTRIGQPMTDPGGLGTVAFSPSGKVLASTGSQDVRFWSVRRHREIGPPLVIGHDGANAVAFSPTEPVVATADADGTARLWDLATHRQIGPVMAAGNSEAYGSVAFSPNGKWLATTSDIGITRLWSLALYGPVGPPLAVGGHAAVTGVAFGPGGKILAAAGANGTARIWNPGTHRQIGPPVTVPRHSGLTGIAISPGATVLAIAGGGDVWLQNAATRRLIGSPMPGVNPADAQLVGPNGLAFSPSGATLAFVSTVNGDTALRLWDVTAHRQMGRPIRGDGSIVAVAFSPNGKMFVTGGYGQTALLWNAKNHRRIGAPMSVGSGFDLARAVAFSPDGKTLAIAAGDQVQLWNVATQQPDGAVIVAGDGGGAAVAFSPDGQLLATADADGTVLLWDVATQQQIGPAMTPSEPGGVNAVMFSPNGKLLATADGDGTVQFLDVAFPRHLARAVCSIAGRSLTPNEWNNYARGEPYQKVC
jgi:WD40 repeat protein